MYRWVDFIWLVVVAWEFIEEDGIGEIGDGNDLKRGGAVCDDINIVLDEFEADDLDDAGPNQFCDVD